MHRNVRFAAGGISYQLPYQSITETSPAASTTTMGEEDEEDYGALIYRESQLRKAEVVAKNTKKRNKDRPLVFLHHLKSVQKTNPSRRSESSM